jgi:hypothetical protein
VLRLNELGECGTGGICCVGGRRQVDAGILPRRQATQSADMATDSAADSIVPASKPVSCRQSVLLSVICTMQTSQGKLLGAEAPRIVVNVLLNAGELIGPANDMIKRLFLPELSSSTQVAIDFVGGVRLP